MIYIVSPTESVLTNRGKRHPDLAMLFCKQNKEVTYITTNFDHANKCLISSEEIQRVKQNLPYNIIFLNNHKYDSNLSFKRVLWNYRFSKKVFNLLKSRSLNQRDTVILPSRPSELIYYMSRIKDKYRVNLVLDIRDIWPDSLTSGGIIKKAFDYYCEFFQKKSVAKYDTYFHVAPSFKKWLFRYNKNVQSNFIPLGIDSRFYDFKIDDKLNNKGLNIIYGGTLTHQFDISKVIDAISGRNIKFTVFGDNGSGERYKDVLNQSKKNTNISLLGMINPREVPCLYKSAKISVIIMKVGALPNKVFDAIGSFTPILSIGDSDVSNFVKTYDIGWVVQNDKIKLREFFNSISDNEIADKIENIKLIRDKFLRKNLLERYAQKIN